MRINITKTIIFVLFFAHGLVPLHTADIRTSPITVNLIIDGSQALTGVRDEVSAWVSAALLDRILQNGDQVTVWSAGGKAQTVYSGTLRDGAEKDAIKQAIAAIPGLGDAPDFAGALREAASRSPDGGISYTVLVSGSPAALSPTLLGPQAGLVKFSRIEEFPSWRAMIVALNIDSKVRRAATGWLADAS
jgi:hypothetical protein